MKKIMVVFVVTILLFLSVQIKSQTDAEKIDDLINRYYEYGLFNGSALVVKSGEVIFKKGYGYANLEWQVPNSSDTKFRIGSVSKQITAALILQLVEEGRIDLSGKISDYLPNYRKDTGDKVTIHQLLNHTSGITSYTNLPNVWLDSLRNHYSKEYFIKHFHSSDLDFEPDSSYSYNNTGYFLLAAIIEEVTDRPFGEYLKEKILVPVGMVNSGSEDDEKVIDQLASGYMKQGFEYVHDRYIFMPNVMGAGHMHSTVEDMVKWDRALYGAVILTEESKKKMFTPYLANYGYGWGINYRKLGETGDSIKVISHSGGINGFTTLFVRLVDDKHMIVLFNNTGGSPRGKMAEQIGNILYGLDYEYPKRPIGKYLLTVIEEEGVESAVQTYYSLKDEEGTLFDFSENELNTLGYAILRNGKIKEAIEIFKLNIEAYPKSSNVYDSMGEAYMNDGKDDKAIENYQKSIELNPGNTRGIEMLKKLGVEFKSDKVRVSIEQLNKYVGEYELMPNFIITISLERGKLFAQATGQPEFQIFPLSQTKFYYKVVNAQIEFTETDAGEVHQLILFQGGREMPAHRVK